METAGGVLSPGPSGTVQADLYRPLRLPVVLVGDSNLEGISSTISSFESLHMRGYDINALVTFENNRYHNHRYFNDYIKDKVSSIVSVSPPPEYSGAADEATMSSYYENLSSDTCITELVQSLDDQHAQRIEKLESLSRRAEE